MKKLSVGAIYLIWLKISGWGFFAHKQINYYATFCVPEPLFFFYKPYINLVSELSVAPDKRRYKILSEGPKHHIDMDFYVNVYFIKGIPFTEDSLLKVVPKDTIAIRGRLPWAIVETYNKLVAAFKDKDIVKIIKYSADLGHYVADACVPLHTTSNYNGQFTGQTGIHSLWESRVPELFSDSFNLIVGTAQYIQSPLKFAWELIYESFALVDSTLKLEADVTNQLGIQNKYTYEKIGKRTIRVVSKDFAQLYYYKLNKMQERRMRRAILAVASYWYSAWIEAGKPHLNYMPLDESVFNETYPQDTLKQFFDRAVVDE